MSPLGNNIFSLLEGVECDPSKVIENANLVHKASAAPAPPKKEKIPQKEISKKEAALDLQQHILNSSQNRIKTLRRERQGNYNYNYNKGYHTGYVSNGRQQEYSKGSQEKDGELKNYHNNNGGRYYDNGNRTQGGSRGAYYYNNQYRNNNSYNDGRGNNNSRLENQAEIVDQGSASNIQDDKWQEVGSRRNVHKEAGSNYHYGNGRRRYNNDWQNRGNHINSNGFESTEGNSTVDVDGSEEAHAVDGAADIADARNGTDDFDGSEKAPAIDAAAAVNSEIDSPTADSKSEVAQGDGGANANGSEGSAAEKQSGGEEKKKKKKKSKKINNGDQFGKKEKEAQSAVDDRKLMTLKEYEKLQLQKKEALEALKSGEARKVRVEKDLESMQVVEKKRKEESDVLKKKEDKEQAEKKKASTSVIKKKGIDEFVKPKTLAGGRPRGGGIYQYQERRNYGYGERFNNQSTAGRGRGKKGIDEFVKPKTLAGGRPRGGGIYQYQERRNHGDGERFNNQSTAGRGRGNYPYQQHRANYGEFGNNERRGGGWRVFNGGRGSGGVNYNNTSSSAGGDGATVKAGAVSGSTPAVAAVARGGVKDDSEFAIDLKQFPAL